MGLATAWGHVFAIRVTDRVGKGLRGAPRDAMLAASGQLDPGRGGPSLGLELPDNIAGAGGNVAAAALPMTLALEAEQLEAGQRVLLLGVGSGLNSTYMEIDW